MSIMPVTASQMALMTKAASLNNSKRQEYYSASAPKTEPQKKDHFVRNTIIIAGVGAGLGFLVRYLANQSFKYLFATAKQGNLKSCFELLKIGQDFKATPGLEKIICTILKSKVMLPVCCAIDLIVPYWAGKTVVDHFRNKDKSQNNHLGRNLLVASGVGAGFGFLNLKKGNSAIAWGMLAPMLYLAAKAPWDHFTGKKTEKA